MDANKFPRTKDLPTQSPLFWVGQKDRYLRQLLIKDIEETTKRGLLVYFTDCTSATAVIDHNDEPYLTELLAKCPDGEYDLMLETNGGLTDSTENVVSTLQNWGKPFRVIVPSRAKSNGTLVALAASSIVMGPNSELGPIDPHLSGIPCTLIEEAHKLNPASVQPIMYHAALHAMKQTEDLATKLLTNGMMKGQPDAEIKKVVTKLATRNHFHSHGCVIDHDEAKSLGLSVDVLAPTDELWQRLWLLRCMYAHDSKMAKVAKIFESGMVGLSIKYSEPPPSP